jgi:hypothetical protein
LSIYIYIYIEECDDTGSPDLGKRARYSMTKGFLLLHMIYLYSRSESRIPTLWNNEKGPIM